MRRFVLLLMGMLFAGAAYGGTRWVEGQTTGRYYNDVWKKWSNQPLRVYIDDEGNVYIAGGEGLLEAVGYFPGKQLRQVTALLQKSMEWSKKAKANQIEITKALGSFVTGDQYKKQGVELTFFAASKGEQTDVIMKIHGFDNMFKKIELYLSPDQVKELIGLLNKAPATYRELKTQEQKAKLLE